MLFVFLRQIIKADPTLPLFDPLEFLHNLRLTMTGLFDGLPEIQEIRILNQAIVINVDLIEELLSRYFCKSSFPVIQSLLLVNFIRVVDVKNFEYLAYFIFTFSCQLKNITFFILPQRMNQDPFQIN